MSRTGSGGRIIGGDGWHAVSGAGAPLLHPQLQRELGFPEDVLDAFRGRLEKDPEVEITLRQLAIDNDEPSVRASTVRRWRPRRQGKASTWQRSCWPPRVSVDVRGHHGSRWTFLTIASVRLGISCARCWRIRRLARGDAIIGARERVVRGIGQKHRPAASSRCPPRRSRGRQKRPSRTRRGPGGVPSRLYFLRVGRVGWCAK